MKSSQIISALALTLLLAGCDLFGSEPDTRVVATGTVVLAETGEPLGGLGVVLRASGGVGSSAFIRARTTTADDGSFELTYVGSEGAGYIFRINDDPYDERYRTFTDPMHAPERKDFGVIELPRTQ